MCGWISSPAWGLLVLCEGGVVPYKPTHHVRGKCVERDFSLWRERLMDFLAGEGSAPNIDKKWKIERSIVCG